jgi:hypothetical protein
VLTLPQARRRMSGSARPTGLQGNVSRNLRYSGNNSLCVSLQLPTAALSDWNAPESRSTRSCRPDRRDVVSRSVWTAQTRTPSSGASRGTHGSLAPTTDPSVSSAGGCTDLVFGKSANPRPEPGMSDPQMLRFCQAGHCGPSRQARTNRELPHGSALAANRDPRGFLAANRDPHGFLARAT